MNEQTKIIFLDIDGVLNLYTDGRDAHGHCFSEACVDNLRRLVKETDAKIVLSSAWRMKGLPVMEEMWRTRRMPGELLSITPPPQTVVARRTAHTLNDVIRGHEVDLWIQMHEEVLGVECGTKYVILDDRNDFLPNQLPYLVQTVGDTDGGLVRVCGLDDACTDKAIAILNS